MSATEGKNTSVTSAVPPQGLPRNKGSDEVITHLFPNDVLFGRGSGPNDHEGNIRFRLLIGERKGEYMATNHRQTKAKIARDIVNRVLAVDGRFLKKVEAADAKQLGLAKGIDAWTLADEETIMEKAKQALRQHREKGSDKSPNGSPVPQPKATQTPAQIHLEKFSVRPPFGKSRPEEHQILSMAHITADSPLSSDYMPVMGQSNPYDPAPIRHYSEPSDSLVDWRDFPSSNIVSNHPVYMDAYTSGQQQQQHHLEQFQAAQRLHQMAAAMPPPCRVVEGPDQRNKFRVVELTDSLNKLKTRNDYGSEFNESNDTMGTIEPLPMNNSKDISTFSGVSMSSSTFSIMKGALESTRADSTKSIASIERSNKTVLRPGSDPRYDPSNVEQRASPAGRGRNATEQAVIQDIHRLNAPDPRRTSINIEDSDFFPGTSQRRSSQKLGASADMSMTLSQVWREDKRQNFMQRAIREGKEDEEHETQQNTVESKPRPDPRLVDMMEEEPDNMSSLGKSSMSILNIAMGESVDSALLSAPNDSIFSDMGD